MTDAPQTCSQKHEQKYQERVKRMTDELKCDDCGGTNSVLEYKGMRFTVLMCRECRNKIPAEALAVAARNFSDPKP